MAGLALPRSRVLCRERKNVSNGVNASVVSIKLPNSIVIAHSYTHVTGLVRDCYGERFESRLPDPSLGHKLMKAGLDGNVHQTFIHYTA